MQRRRLTRGISPVIATVILVAIAVSITLLAFTWSKALIPEQLTIGGKNIQLVCADVVFEATYTQGVLRIANMGNIPIYSIEMRRNLQGSYTTARIQNVTELQPGAIFTLTFTPDDAKSITLYPILLGSSNSGDQTFTCTEHGITITLQ